MFDTLTNVTWGLIVFAVMIGVGSLVLFNFANSLTGTANTTVSYLLTQLGSTSGGLASWAPAIIAVTIGILFIGYLGSVGGGKRRR